MKFQPLTIAAGLFCAGFVPSASAFDTETFGTADFVPARPEKPPLMPLSTQHGYVLPEDLPAYSLPPINEAQAFAEDALDATLSFTKTVRYGLGRDLLFQMQDGVWHDLSGGRWLWTADIVSQDAVGIRLHIVEMNMPESAQLVVYAPRDPANVAGPYEGRGLNDDGQLWTPTRAGERVRVEYLTENVPFATSPGVPPFFIDRLQHIYRDPSKLGYGEEGAGSCHNDVTCYSAYNNLKNACAGIGTVGSNSLYCSGQMLNNLSGDLTPYWITANHCLSTAADATNAEIYWRYQTSTCNGTPPSLASVPTSAGCSLLSTSANSDYTLLMINGALPSGLYWAGWTSGAQSTGEPGAAIHHPSGDFKRISFGTYSTTQTCDTTGHFRVNWTNGPTEPGSSGSGFFRTDTQQFVGQLHCGPSACLNETYDGYGRFADTYNTGSVDTYMAGGPDDSLEPNDTCGGNPDIAVGSYNAVVKSTDDDWYEISVPNGAQLTVNLSFTHANGDVDTQLWVNCGDATYTDISQSVTNSESITWVNDTGAANTVAWIVYLYSDTRNNYSMTVSLSPPNNSCATAIAVSDNITYVGSNYNASNSVSGSCGLSTTSPDVWYEYNATATGTLEIRTFITTASDLDTVVSVYSDCTLATELGCNDDAGLGAAYGEGTLSSYLLVPVVTGNDYFIRVAGYNGLEGAFRLRVDTDTGAPFCVGDGISGLNCPCSNNSSTTLEAGCENSTGTAGRLTATGVPDVSSDTVDLIGTAMPANSTCLYFQGSAKQASGNGVAFGDGLRCAAGTVIRLGTKTNSASGTSSYPTGADLSVSDRGLLPSTGGTRYYQCWYRNAVSFCTTSTFNLSNGYELIWRP